MVSHSGVVRTDVRTTYMGMFQRYYQSSSLMWTVDAAWVQPPRDALYRNLLELD